MYGREAKCIFLGVEIKVLHIIFTTITLSTVLSTKPTLRSPYIQDYDVIEYDHVHLRDHHVSKRSTALKFKFKAFGRTFTPLLRKDNGHIYQDFMFETSTGHRKREPPLLYSGIIQEDESKIHGVLKKKGHFEGRITSQNETFYIERASHHFDDVTNFHTIIYKHSDVIFNTSQSFCAHSKLLNTQKSLIPDAFNDNLSANRHWNKNEFVYQRKRKKRAVDPTKKICELYMEADHLLYQKFESDEDTVIEKLTEHVQALNAIYNDIDFDNSGHPDSIGFIIKKIKIWDDPTVDGYKYDDNYAVDYLLNLYSDGNFDDYCLSYLFTNRDFSDGVLGLAWLGNPSTSVAGGVCETHKTFNGEGKSLNSGVVTFLNYGSDVPSSVSHSTFAHEIGHNFGSDHDPTGNIDCTPGDPTGNYIMYPLSTSGHKENNFKLSNCSTNQIQPVIAEKARGEDGCFVDYTVALCGNRIVEEGEECDCGWEGECLESCCNPQVNDTTLPGVETPCTLRSTSVCRPSGDLQDIPTGKSLPGTPCNHFKGYCDVFNICRQVNPEGPLSNLKKLLTGDAFNAVKGFIEEHWYLGIILGLAMFISILLVVKFCSKSTKDIVKPLEKPDSQSPLPRPNQIAPQTYM
ncbi:Disintegrin and metalloproteinase domain-containing protein 10 [Mactra antiquata]